eukprot:TRINITY_DN21767_c0_g1_i2.p1 TRINITY_DN21767_c0_g1~~TRINITY_DN21767_c0_g1_i2.p1  ORF type:complete len:663 (+),score=73.12 TRINITY_DN21767_c0_g1_i2:153-1991(+)
MHRYGFWLRAFRQNYGLRKRPTSSSPATGGGVKVPFGGFDFKVISLDSCVVGDGGDTLRASLLLPQGIEGPFPSVLMRTPYGRKSDFGQVLLAKRGYAVLVQDTRGRFSSDGEFVPVQNEREDGPATVDWMRQQPWCNGKVGVTGVSYLGFTAWACLDGAQVDAIVPVITRSSVREAVFLPGGAFSLELVVLWFYLVVHLLADVEKNPWSFVRKLLRGQWQGTVPRSLQHTPLADVDSLLLGYKHDFLQAGLAAHENPTDTFWHDKDKLCNFERVPPCHILTGWYDFFLDGSLQDYALARKNQPRVQLTIGPFHHWSILGSPRLFIETMCSWFDEHLKNEGTGSNDAMPVLLYVLGLGWRRYTVFPPTVDVCSLWLGADYSLLSISSGSGVEHSYVFDPADPTPSLGGPSFNLFNAGARDQHDVESRRDVLVYTSAPAQSTFQVVGHVRLRLQASWEAASVDFVGRLCHVDRSGRSTNLCEGLTKCSSSNSDTTGSGDGGSEVRRDAYEHLIEGQNADRAAIVTTGTSVAIVDVQMSATAVSVRKGERIRLHVCSSAHPRWIRNLGSNEPLSKAATFTSGRVWIHAGELLLPFENASGISFAELLSGPAARL